MAIFNWKKFPYTNFHELNLDYFINKFNEIFEEWENLYNTINTWKDETTTELEEWKTATEQELDDKETALLQELNEWKTTLESDWDTWRTNTNTLIFQWENQVLIALNEWKTATTAAFEEIRTQAANSATAAANSATASATSATAAANSATAAANSASGIAASAAQITENTNDIADLNKRLFINNDSGEDIFSSYATFNNGGLSRTQNNEIVLSNEKYRVSTLTHIKFNHDIIISVKDGFRWSYIPYEDTVPLIYSGWIKTPYIMPANTEFIVQIAEETEHTSVIADIKTFVNAVTFTNKSESGVNINNRKIDEIRYVQTLVSKYNFEQGSINADGMNDGGTNTKRRRTALYIPRKIAQKLYNYNNTIRYAIYYYKANYDFISLVTWQTNNIYTLEYPQNAEYIRIVCARIDDGVLNYVDYNNIENNIYLSGGNIDEISKSLLPLREYSNFYKGEKMPSKVHGFNKKSLFTMSYSGISSQDIEVFGNYLFVAFSSNSDTEYIRVYSLIDYSLIAQMTAETHHGGGMQFSNEYYDINDIFPLLYVGGTANSIISVIRITNNNNTWACTTIRTLKIPGTYMHHASPSVFKNMLICSGYKNTPYTTESNNAMVIGTFDLKRLTANEDNTYSPAVLNIAEFPYMKTTQGRKYLDGTLYLSFSNTSSPYNPKIYGFDLATGAIKTEIDLSNILASEMEGIAFYTDNDNNIKWIVTDYYNVVELTF